MKCCKEYGIVGGLREKSGIGKQGWYKNYFCNRIIDFSIGDYYAENLIHNLDKISEFAAAAAKLAFLDSNLNLDGLGDIQKGVCLGVSHSIATSMSDFDESVLVEGARRCNIGIFPNAVMCAPASRISILEKIKGSNTTFSSGRNSGLDAIGFGFIQIRLNEKKIIIAGGAEALSSKILLGFERENLLFEVSNPDNLSSKTGKFVPTEGAAVFLLSSIGKGQPEILAFNNSFASTKKRNITHRVEVLSHNISATLNDAKISSSKVDAIMISNYFDVTDREVEQKAIAALFSERLLNQIPIFSFKKAIGENFSAYGGMSILCAVGLIKNKFSNETKKYFNLNQRDFIIKS
jgi:3-oxoacyl-[acyl-carrier-protein] synthase II